MITRVTLRHFKRFTTQDFELSSHVVLAGPNNSGKTTLIQAIAVWNLALQRWMTERGSGSQAKQRIGVPITRKEFTAIPLRELNLLWTDRSTAMKAHELEGKHTGQPRVLEIRLQGQTEDRDWQVGFEFRYQNSELIYVKPVAGDLAGVPVAGKGMTIVHVPPFSGIGPDETRLDRAYQDLLIGQGKPGDILRNLLLEVSADKQNWEKFVREIQDTFGFTLLPPQYESRPYILCEYVPRPDGRGPRLDIATAGSGFLQVLLLFGFLYARRGTVLLLDEPDAHLHVVLQKAVYDRLRSLAAERKSQLIIATHSEVIVDGTSPSQILSFYNHPHLLVSDTERDQVREALKRLSAMDILLAEQGKGILYLEGETDFNLLRAWAKVLNHPMYKWFLHSPFWHSNRGRNRKDATNHFFALQAIQPSIKGYLLIDGDDRGLPDHEVSAEGLQIGRWKRYEAESYLIHPDALSRYAEKLVLPLWVHAGRSYLTEHLPPAVLRDPKGDHEYFDRTPVSHSLLPRYFKAIGQPMPRNNYYLIAEQMLPDEVPSEVRSKLDEIAAALGIAAPATAETGERNTIRG